MLKYKSRQGRSFYINWWTSHTDNKYIYTKGKKRKIKKKIKKAALDKKSAGPKLYYSLPKWYYSQEQGLSIVILV